MIRYCTGIFSHKWSGMIRYCTGIFSHKWSGMIRYCTGIFSHKWGGMIRYCTGIFSHKSLLKTLISPQFIRYIVPCRLLRSSEAD
jgi:hypothetical protein